MGGKKIFMLSYLISQSKDFPDLLEILMTLHRAYRVQIAIACRLQQWTSMFPSEGQAPDSGPESLRQLMDSESKIYKTHIGGGVLNL